MVARAPSRSVARPTCPKGGPDGGDGGNGGDVWLVADRNVASLLGFRDHPHRRATSGAHGQGKRRHGRSGEDLIVPVPEGTMVKDANGVMIADLVREGDRYLAAEGGRGGRGNARFLSNRRRAPSFAEQGEAGDERGCTSSSNCWPTWRSSVSRTSESRRSSR